jgi:hypothetical protein
MDLAPNSTKSMECLKGYSAKTGFVPTRGVEWKLPTFATHYTTYRFVLFFPDASRRVAPLLFLSRPFLCSCARSADALTRIRTLVPQLPPPGDDKAFALTAVQVTVFLGRAPASWRPAQQTSSPAKRPMAWPLRRRRSRRRAAFRQRLHTDMAASNEGTVGEW